MQAMKAESATPVKGAATKHCCCGHYDGGENAFGHCEDCDVIFWLLARQREWQPDSQPASQPASPVEGSAMKAMKAKAAAPVKAAAMKEMKAEAATPVKGTAMKAMKATRQPRPKFSEDNLCWGDCKERRLRCEVCPGARRFAMTTMKAEAAAHVKRAALKGMNAKAADDVVKANADGGTDCNDIFYCSKCRRLAPFKYCLDGREVCSTCYEAAAPVEGRKDAKGSEGSQEQEVAIKALEAMKAKA